MAAHGGWIVGGEHALALGPQQFGRRVRSFGSGIERPAEMLASMAQAYAQAVVRKQFVVELVDQGELNRERGRCFAATAVKTARDLAGQPGTALRGASDHHSVGARSGKRSPGIVHRADVAVDHERNRDRVLDRPHGPPVGVALVELAAGAPVYGHKADAGRLRATRKLGRVPGAVIPTEPHLERYRHRHRGHRGLDQGERMIEIAHQRRARLATDHVAGRTAHVDIDHRRAACFSNAGTLAHPARLASSELHHVDAETAAFRAQHHVGTAFDQRLARRHFGNDKAGAEPRDESAHRRIGDSRHGGQDHTVRHPEGANEHRRWPQTRSDSRHLASLHRN